MKDDLPDRLVRALKRLARLASPPLRPATNAILTQLDNNRRKEESPPAASPGWKDAAE